MADPLKRVDCIRCGKQHVSKSPMLLRCPACKALLPDSFIFIILFFIPSLGMMFARLAFFFVPVGTIETNSFVNSYVGQFLAGGLTRFESLLNWLISPVINVPDTTPVISIYGWQEIPSLLYFSLLGIGFGIGIYIYRVIRYPVLRRLGWVYEKRSDSWFAVKGNKTIAAGDKKHTTVSHDRPSVLDSKYLLITQLAGYKFYKWGDDINVLFGGNLKVKKRYFRCPRCNKRLLYPSPPNCPHCNRDMQDFAKISKAPTFFSESQKDFEAKERARQNLTEAQEELDYAIANKFPQHRIEEIRNLVDLAERELETIEAKDQGGGKQRTTLLNTLSRWIISATDESVFFCKSCEEQVSRDTKQCPHCGIWLSGIECQDCGFTGRVEEFINNRCPSCDTIVES